MGQLGSVELLTTNGGWNGDLVLADNGDLALAIDSISNPIATSQRMLRLILSNAAIFDPQTGVPVSEADDSQYPWYGASIRAEIGAMITPALLAGFKARILQALGTDPSIVQNPAPVVTITTDNVSMVSIVVSVTLKTGQQATLPSILLNLSTGAVATVESS